MKKILNIVGYISLIAIPYMALVYVLVLHIPIKIISLTILFLLIIMQIINFKKTKKRNIGIRILTTVIIIFITTSIIHNGYGIIKNIEGKKILNNIERIEIGDYKLEKEDLKSAKIQFVNEASIITKGTLNAIIYYKDIGIENIKIFYSTPDPNAYMYEINGNKYYIRTF